MKIINKPLGALALTLIFTFSLTNQAEARPFWGEESDEIVAYQNGSICTTTHNL